MNLLNNKTKIILLTFSFLFIFSIAQNVKADTLLPGDISTCGTLAAEGTYNLTNDVGAIGETCFTITSSGVIITGSSNISGDIVADAISSNSAGFSFSITNTVINGNISSYGNGSGSVGTVTFTNNAYNMGSISGNAIFNDSSYNGYDGSVEGNATFNNTSSNGGTITGNATFNNTSFNLGTVGGNANFNNTSSDQGTVGGNAIFNNYTASSGIVTVSGDTNFYGTGNVTGTIKDSVGATITTWNLINSSVLLGNLQGNATLNDTSYIGENGVVTGNATFNNASNNQGIVSGNAIFNTTSNNQGNVVGNVMFNMYTATAGTVTVNGNTNFFGTGWVNGTIKDSAGATITTWNLTNGSVLVGNIDGNAVFNDTSTSQGSVTGDATFNMFTAASGVVTISGNTNFFGTGEVGAIVKDSTGATITTWNFTNGSVLNGILEGAVIFNDTSSNQYLIFGDATFKGTSNNGGYITGNATFNDKSTNTGFVDGTTTIPNSSSNTTPTQASSHSSGSSITSQIKSLILMGKQKEADILKKTICLSFCFKYSFFNSSFS